MALIFKNLRSDSAKSPHSFVIGEEKIIFNSRGVVPAILQAPINGSSIILDLVYLNNQALELSLNSGVLFVYRRSKKQVERLGENTGNTYKIQSIYISRNHRALLITILDDHGELPAVSFYKKVYSI